MTSVERGGEGDGEGHGERAEGERGQKEREPSMASPTCEGTLMLIS